MYLREKEDPQSRREPCLLISRNVMTNFKVGSHLRSNQFALKEAKVICVECRTVRNSETHDRARCTCVLVLCAVSLLSLPCGGLKTYAGVITKQTVSRYLRRRLQYKFAFVVHINTADDPIKMI